MSIFQMKHVLLTKIVVLLRKTAGNLFCVNGEVHADFVCRQKTADLSYGVDALAAAMSHQTSRLFQFPLLRESHNED